MSHSTSTQAKLNCVTFIILAMLLLAMTGCSTVKPVPNCLDWVNGNKIPSDKIHFGTYKPI